MSSNSPEPKPRIDRRVQRTREQLGDALVALITEKPFDSITVQDVLNRAEVSRSTFYTHYRDKNDLFISDVDDFFEMMAGALSRHGDTSDRVAPVRELFAHIADVREFYNALVASGRIADILELGQGHFARGIEQRLSELPRARHIAPPARAPLAHAHAGALLSLMSWWIRHDMQPPPAQMDELFHKMVWSGVAAST